MNAAQARILTHCLRSYTAAEDIHVPALPKDELTGQPNFAVDYRQYGGAQVRVTTEREWFLHLSSIAGALVQQHHERWGHGLTDSQILDAYRWPRLAAATQNV